MKIRIALVITCIGVHIAVYPAAVTIKNQTSENVWVRVNEQNRVNTFYNPADTSEDTWREFLPVIKVTGSLRKTRIANFIPLLAKGTRTSSLFGIPLDTTTLATVKFTGGFKKGTYSRAILPLGAPITKITFARVTGRHTITGTLADLEKTAQKLNTLYGGMEFLPKKHTYKNSWLHIDTRVFKHPGESVSIEVPDIETFTYHLPAAGIIKRNKKGIVKLLSWGHAERVE